MPLLRDDWLFLLFGQNFYVKFSAKNTTQLIKETLLLLEDKPTLNFHSWVWELPASPAAQCDLGPLTAEILTNSTVQNEPWRLCTFQIPATAFHTAYKTSISHSI